MPFEEPLFWGSLRNTYALIIRSSQYQAAGTLEACGQAPARHRPTDGELGWQGFRRVLRVGQAIGCCCPLRFLPRVSGRQWDR